MTQIHKPAAWENTSFEDLLACQAGQAYVADQLRGHVDPEWTFRSDRTNSDPCSYDLFEDGSLWFHSNAEDEIWADANDFIQQFEFTGLYWDECENRDGLLVNSMDRELLIHLLEEEEAREFFKRSGGIVPWVELAKVVDGGYETVGSFEGIEDAKASLTDDGDYVASNGDNPWKWGFRVTDGEVVEISPENM